MSFNSHENLSKMMVKLRREITEIFNEAGEKEGNDSHRHFS